VKAAWKKTCLVDPACSSAEKVRFPKGRVEYRAPCDHSLKRAAHNHPTFSTTRGFDEKEEEDELPRLPRDNNDSATLPEPSRNPIEYFHDPFGLVKHHHDFLRRNVPQPQPSLNVHPKIVYTYDPFTIARNQRGFLDIALIPNHDMYKVLLAATRREWKMFQSENTNDAFHASIWRLLKEFKPEASGTVHIVDGKIVEKIAGGCLGSRHQQGHKDRRGEKYAFHGDTFLKNIRIVSHCGENITALRR